MEKMDKPTDTSSATPLLDWLLICFVIFLPVQLDVGLAIHIAPSDLFIMLWLICGIGQLRLRREAYSIWHFAFLALFLVGLYIALLRLGFITRYALINKEVGMLVLVAIYVVVTSAVSDWAKLRKLLRIFVFTTAIHAVIALAVYFSGWEIPGINRLTVRISGMLLDPNAFGGLLTVALAIHMAASHLGQPLAGKVWNIWICFSLMLGIVLTFSRSAWIGLMCVLLGMAVLRASFIFRILTIIGMAIMAVLLIKGNQFFGELLHLASRPEQIKARIDILQDAAAMFWQYPVFGGGLGSYLETYGIIIHNTPVWFFSEFGLVGATIFAGFVSWFLFQGYKVAQVVDRSQKPLVLGLLLAHLAMLGLSLGIEALYQRHWWFILALIAASITCTKRQANP